MKVRLLRPFPPLGAFAAMLLYGSYFGVRLLLRRDGAETAPLLDLLEKTVIVGGLAPLIASLSTTFARRYYQHAFSQLASHVAGLRQDPAPHALTVKGGVLASSPELKHVRDELERLVECYRKALADVVRLQEKTELLETSDSRGVAVQADGNQAVTTPRYVGSSRHRMVARLAPNLHWIAATPPLLQFLNTTNSHIVARSFLDSVHHEDAPTLRRTLQERSRTAKGTISPSGS